MKQPNYNTPLEAVKAMLGGAMKFNVWNKLVKRELYQKNAITFPAGFSMGEDMTMILPLYLQRRFIMYLKHFIIMSRLIPEPIHRIIQKDI